MNDPQEYAIHSDLNTNISCFLITYFHRLCCIWWSMIYNDLWAINNFILRFEICIIYEKFEWDLEIYVDYYKSDLYRSTAIWGWSITIYQQSIALFNDLKNNIWIAWMMFSNLYWFLSTHDDLQLIIIIFIDW